MTQQLPAPGENLPRVPAQADLPAYVWTDTGWAPAPAGSTPPVAWWPADGGWRPAPPGWLPPPDWVRTPSGAFPPPGALARPAVAAGAPSGTPDAGTRAFGWVRCLPGRLQRAAAAADRRPSGWEIVVVLTVFPLEAFVAALVSLSQTLSNYSDGSVHSPELVPAHPVLGALLLAADAVSQFAPAVVVLYLLRLSGGGARAIGLDLTRPRADLARCAKLVLYSFVPGFLLLGILLHLTPHIDTINDPTNLPLVFLIPSFVQSVGAGVVEEIVVLGFLVHRLEQRGWDGWQLYAVCIAVRLSYHLYYGTGAIGLAVWAGMSVFLYRRRRRLLTFVVAHAIWDTNAFAGQFVHGAAQSIPVVITIAALVGLWLVGRGPAAAEMAASGQAIARRETARSTPT